MGRPVRGVAALIILRVLPPKHAAVSSGITRFPLSHSSAMIGHHKVPVEQPVDPLLFQRVLQHDVRQVRIRFFLSLALLF